MVASSPPKPPKVAERFPLQNAMSLRSDFLGFLQRLHAAGGDLARFRAAGMEFVLVSDPNAIREVLASRSNEFTKGRVLNLRSTEIIIGNGLLRSEGAVHRRQRRRMQPELGPSRIAGYTEIMVRHAEQLSSSWTEAYEVDMAGEMRRLMLGIAGEAFFGGDVLDEAREIGSALKATLDLFPRFTLPFANQLLRLPLPANRRFWGAKDRLDRTVYRLIQQRRATQVDRNDVLTRLLQAHDAEGAMTEEQLRSEMITLLTAGHETTAEGLTWTWHLLSRYPDALDRVRREVDSVIGEGQPTYDDLSQLRFTRQVFTEALRLYPPAFFVERQPINDIELSGYHIPRQTQIWTSQWVVHRNPKYYARPNEFDPDRWTEDFQRSLPSFAFFPFGGGPRICIGEPFAWAEALISLAILTREWTPEPMPDPPVEPEPLFTLRPRHGLPIRLHRRKDQVAPSPQTEGGLTVSLQ